MIGVSTEYSFVNNAKSSRLKSLASELRIAASLKKRRVTLPFLSVGYLPSQAFKRARLVCAIAEVKQSIRHAISPICIGRFIRGLLLTVSDVMLTRAAIGLGHGWVLYLVYGATRFSS